MRQCMKELEIMLNSRFNIIWVDTFEENAFIEDLKALITNSKFFGTNLYIWSISEGLKKAKMCDQEEESEAQKNLGDIGNLMREINSHRKNKFEDQNFYVLRDLHQPLEAIQTARRHIRDIYEYPAKNYNPIIIVAPSCYIPIELEKDVHIFKYDLLTKDEIVSIINKVQGKMKMAMEKKSSHYILHNEEEVEQIAKALTGLTDKEIVDTIAYSTKKYNEISIESVIDQKIELIKKSGVLDFVVPKANIDDVGGNVNFKNWINEVELAMTPEAEAFGCSKPKGYLALGIPGCCKSKLAEAIAAKWHVPLIQLQMSKIMDKLVGNSEKKMEQALRIVEACAPCVFLIDEIEKALGGVKSSNASDSGTTSRVFAQLLAMLQNNNNGVFVVMTSNDISQLPPELTRRGRLDEIWYFSLPSKEERKEIFDIYLKKTGKKYDESILEEAVKLSDHFTGAEIESAVKMSLWKAYKRFTQDHNDTLTIEDIAESIKAVVPMYQSAKETITFLETWARGRARFANLIVDSNGFNKQMDLDIGEFDNITL